MRINLENFDSEEAEGSRYVLTSPRYHNYIIYMLATNHLFKIIIYSFYNLSQFNLVELWYTDIQEAL